MKSSIRYLLLALIAVACGVVPAYLYYKYEVKVHEEEFFTDQWSQSKAGVVGPMISVVGLRSYDFGIIDPEQNYSREFIIENNGDVTLEIWSESQASGIVQIDLGSDPISVAAGSSYPIEVSFDGNNVESELKTSIVIKSNDERYSSDDFKIKLTGKAKN